MPDLQSMIGKEVEVIANGVSYTGVLVEVSDSEVHLKGSMQWISLPAISVSTVRLKSQSPQTTKQEDEEPEQIETVLPHNPDEP